MLIARSGFVSALVVVFACRTARPASDAAVDAFDAAFDAANDGAFVDGTADVHTDASRVDDAGFSACLPTCVLSLFSTCLPAGPCTVENRGQSTIVCRDTNRASALLSATARVVVVARADRSTCVTITTPISSDPLADIVTEFRDSGGVLRATRTHSVSDPDDATYECDGRSVRLPRDGCEAFDYEGTECASGSCPF